MFKSSHRGCPSAERPVHSRSPTLSDWTGSFAEDTYKVLITLNVVVQLQLHYAPYPDLKPALLPRCLLPLHCPLHPPPRPHPGTPRDPLLPQHPVLSNHFRCIPLRHRKTVRVAFMHFQAFTDAKANPEGVRTQTGANNESQAKITTKQRESWQTKTAN
jgi:hypothetical protein